MHKEVTRRVGWVVNPTYAVAACSFVCFFLAFHCSSHACNLTRSAIIQQRNAVKWIGCPNPLFLRQGRAHAKLALRTNVGFENPTYAVCRCRGKLLAYARVFIDSAIKY